MLAVCSLGLAAKQAQAAGVVDDPKVVGSLVEAARNEGFPAPARPFSVKVKAVQGIAAAPAKAIVVVKNKRTAKENAVFETAMGLMTLKADDQAFCDATIGKETNANATIFNECRITRNFLWYAKNKRDMVQGHFPPSAEMSYCRTPAEDDLLMALLKDSMEE